MAPSECDSVLSYAFADLAKEALIKHGAVPALCDILDRGDAKVQSEAVAAIGCLAMHKSGMEHRDRICTSV